LETLKPNISPNNPPEAPIQYSGFFEQARFSPFVITFFVLLLILGTYTILGSLLTLVVSDVNLENLAQSEPSIVFNINDGNLNAIRWVQFLAQVIIIAGPLLILVPLHTGKWKPFSSINLEFLGLKNRIGFKEILFASTTILLLHPLLSLIGELQFLMLDFLFGIGEKIKSDQEAYEVMIKQLTVVRSPIELIAVIGLIAATPAICEELLFRGYVQKNFSRGLMPVLSITLTGFIFGAFHLNIFEFLPLVVLGIYISYLRFQSDSIYVSMSAHFINNFFSIVILLLTVNNNIDALETIQESMLTPESLIATGITTILCYLSLQLYIKAVQSRTGKQSEPSTLLNDV